MQDALTFEEIEESIIKHTPCLDDKPDPKDFQFDDHMIATIAADVNIPDSFTLRSKMTGVKSQGSRGTCVAFGCVAIAEYHNKIEFMRDIDLSEEHFFRKAKEIDIQDYQFTGYGAHLRSGAKALQKYGACLEQLAPYKNTKNEKEWENFVETPQIYSSGQTHRMDSYIRVERQKEAVKKALFMSNAPLLCGVRLMSSYREAKKNGGLVPVPKAGEKEIGGHCMAITGYTDTHIEMKNSWGNWGDAGYIYWPWEAIEYLMLSVWSFVDLKTNPYSLTKIDQNKSKLKDYQRESWEKAIAKEGIITEGSLPTDVMTKGDFIVFADRLGLLDKKPTNNIVKKSSHETV